MTVTTTTALIPAAPRKTLLEWIESDDGNPSTLNRPVCTARIQALHARIVLHPNDAEDDRSEPFQPPPGLRLPPLG